MSKLEDAKIKSFTALTGIFTFDTSKYPSPLRAFRNDDLIEIGRGCGATDNCSRLTDLLTVAEDIIKATKSTSFVVRYIDDGAAFSYTDISDISDEESTSRIDIVHAINAFRSKESQSGFGS